MRPLLACVCLLVTACASLPSARTLSGKPAGELFAAIRVTKGAFSGVPQRDTGYFFYSEDTPGVVGPSLTGYHYENGELRDFFGGGSDSAQVIQAIQDVGLEPFDFSKEVDAVASRLKKEAEAKGEAFIGGFVLDGAEFEITIRTAHGTFRLREWNPGFTIDQFAPHSDRIAKLRAVLEILEKYYGRTKFGI